VKEGTVRRKRITLKSRLKSGNTCYHSVQNPLFSVCLPNNTNIKINRIIILPVFFMRVKIGHSH